MDADVRGQASAWVSASLGLRVNRAVGFELTGTGDITGDISFSTPPARWGWKLTGGLDLSYTIYASVFDKDLFRQTNSLAGLDFEIAQGTLSGDDVHDWSQFGSNEAHSGLCDIPAVKNGSLEWEAIAPTRNVFGLASGPAIDKFGNVYIGDIVGELASFSPNGDLRFATTVHENTAIVGTPAVSSDGSTIYVCTVDTQDPYDKYNGLWALTSGGVVKWFLPTKQPVIWRRVSRGDPDVGAAQRNDFVPGFWR
jgi:hypothetical protein